MAEDAENHPPLAPCPFCAAGETKMMLGRHWTGMSYIVLSATVRHWCQPEAGQPTTILSVPGRTAEDAARRWNQRAGGAQEPVAA